MKKPLRDKLTELRSDLNCGAFILADAKDADMAWGIASPGTGWPPQEGVPGDRMQGMPKFVQQIREVIDQGLVDIMLTSISVMGKLAFEERLFDTSEVTPAIRANDTTDVWVARGAKYREEPSRAFATGFIEEAQHGYIAETYSTPPIVSLGLYSITFTNDLEVDLENLERFKAFRREAELKGFNYMLEVFSPNAPCGIEDENVPAFVNDCLVRAIAGIGPRGRPEFLKIPYMGPRWLEELVQYDPSMIVGILGGGSGTTLDAFQLLNDGKKHGARAAIYGRKIKEAEDPLLFIRMLREIADNGMPPVEAVRAYHGDLQSRKIPTKRSLEDDLQITEAVLLS